MFQFRLIENRSMLSILLILPLFISFCRGRQDQFKARIIISSDIGGTDPDDFQSIIHFMMYANLFQTEGLISSPYGLGRKEHLLKMIDLYEKDLPKLQAHVAGFPTSEELKSICKQGSLEAAPFQGWSKSSEGSDWIIQCAKKENDQPLYILVWGGLEDLAQALHDDPEIEKKIKVYWIGGPNKKWSVNAYAYIAHNYPNLWMIEANATYRGWFLDSESPEELKNDQFYDNFIRGIGAMGADFKNHYNGHIKMGDTPSLVYVMNGNPDDPYGESWGGSFRPIRYSTKNVFNRNSSIEDTVTTYSVVEWYFKGPEVDIPSDSSCFSLEISNQKWPGYYLGAGNYGVRYSSKKPETCTYAMTSDIPGFETETGSFVSVIPWPGKPTNEDYQLGNNWYSDHPDKAYFIGEQQGAKTVSKWRKEFLMDWAERWKWLK